MEHESKKDRRTKVFRDPVHDLIYLGPEDRFILDLINTKEFQRLRRIRQLGLGSFVYPGAEHSRFTHSLGVFDVARRMIRKLIHRHSESESIEDKSIVEALRNNERTIKAAALLHDIGHGAFSHLFERVFREDGAGHKDHEEWTCTILRDPETEVNQMLCNAASREHSADSGPLDPEALCRLISNNEKQPEDPYLRDIVNGQLDADKMDYLLRDSLMTGSRYGQFDAEWIMNSVAIGELRISDDPVKKLCLDARRGTGAIEGLLFARMLMLRYVYGHKTTRAYEAELLQTLRLARRLSSFLPAETPEPVVRAFGAAPLGTKDYLLLDDELMWWTIRRWAVAKPLATPELEALSRHSLRLVRRMKPWRCKPLDIEGALKVSNFVRKLKKENSLLQYECHLDEFEDLPYKGFQLPKGGGKDGEAEQAFFREIFLLNEDGKAERLSAIPDIPSLDGLTKPWRQIRFFYDYEKKSEFSGLF